MRTPRNVLRWFWPWQVRVSEGMSMEQLDVIKLTAQFVARNGKQFLAGEAWHSEIL